MSKWYSTTVGALGTIFDGPHATPARIAEGPYFLNIASLNQGRLDLSQSDHVSEEDFARWTKRVTPRGGDVLFSYETRLGEAALMPSEVVGCLGRRMALIRPNRERVDPRFLLYLYLSPAFQRTIGLHTIRGATVDRIPLNRMGSWAVSVPELTEQQAIAEVLGALDDKIAANSVLAGAAEAFAIAELSMLPANTPLGSLVTLSKKQLSPAVLGPLEVDHYSLPAFDQDGLPIVERADAIRSPKFTIGLDAVLLSKLNPRFPRIWRAAGRPDKRALASTEFLVLEPREVAQELLWAALAQPDFSRHLDARVVGTSGSHQRVKPADALTILVRDARVLSGSVRTSIQAALRLATEVRFENRTLAATRDALLPQLMSGKLRVRDSEALASAAGA